MFSSKLLQLSKGPSNVSYSLRFKSSYQMKDEIEKCASHFQDIAESCRKKEGRGCRTANPSIKCVTVSPPRICKKIMPPKHSFREKLLAENRHLWCPCLNECCCLSHFVHKVKPSKISLNDVVRH